MDDIDRRKQQGILSSLQSNFPGIEVIFEWEPERRLSSYYIRPDTETQWIIKVTDDCIVNNSLATMLQEILTEGMEMIMKSPNVEHILYKNIAFHRSERD